MIMVYAGGHNGTGFALVPCTVYAGGRAASAAKQVNVNELDHGLSLLRGRQVFSYASTSTFVSKYLIGVPSSLEHASTSVKYIACVSSLIISPFS